MILRKRGVYDDLSLTVLHTELKERSTKRRQLILKPISETLADARHLIKDKQHKCPFCEKSFKRRTHLNRHTTVHTGEKPYKCRLCQKSFARMDVCNFHVRNSCQTLKSSTTLPSSFTQAEKFVVETTSHEFAVHDVHENLNDKSCLGSLNLRSYVVIRAEENLRSHVATEGNPTPHVAIHHEENITTHIAACTKDLKSHVVTCTEDLEVRLKHNCMGKSNVSAVVSISGANDMLVNSPQSVSDKSTPDEILADSRFSVPCEEHTSEGSSRKIEAERNLRKASAVKPEVPTHQKKSRKFRYGVRNRKCQYCNKSFKTKSKLERHSRIHSGEKPYHCPLCQKLFARLDTCKLHMKNNCHAKSPNVRLPVAETSEFCVKKDVVERTSDVNNSDSVKTFFSDSVSLIRLPIPLHSEDKPSRSVSCAGCKNHTVCPDNNSHKCESCEMSFRSRRNLNRHLLVHTGERPFKCPLCDKSFARLDVCNFHVKNNCIEKSTLSSIPDVGDSQQVNGPFVSNKLSSGDLLQDSSLAVQKKEKVCKSIAPDKSRRFSYGVKGHECPSCSKSFRTQAHLNRHSRTHTGEKPYKCTLCQKSFSRLDVCKLHMKNNCHLRSSMKLPLSTTDASDLSVKKGSGENGSQKNINLGCAKQLAALVSPKSETTTFAEESKCFALDASHLPVHSASSQPFNSFMIHEKSFLHSLKLKSDKPPITSIEKPSISRRKTLCWKESHDCPCCSKSFQLKSCLERHFRIHTGEKPYSCPSCQKSFARIDSRNLHSKNCHEGKSSVPSASSIPDANHLASNNTFESTSDDDTACKQSTCDAANPDSQAALRSNEKTGDISHLVIEKTSDEGSDCETSIPEAVSLDSQAVHCENQPSKSVAHKDQIKLKRARNRNGPCNCPVCCKLFKSRHGLSKHSIIHTGARPYKCPLCHKSFARSDTCRLHTKSYCELRSSAVFKPVPAANQSPPNDGTPDTRSFKCTICGQLLSEASRLKTHMRAHDRVKPHKCHLCFRAFEHNDQLQSHLTIHLKEKPHKCLVCDKSYPQASSLRNHMKLHTSDKPHKCQLCDLSFFKPGRLQRHMISHSQDRPHECQECNKSFKRSYELTEHMRVHTGEKPYKCQFCPEAFELRSKYSLHMERHQPGDVHSCEICGKSFRLASLLRGHLKTHNRERNCVCHLCGKALSRTSVLRIHLRSHTGERPFKCEICGKSFAAMTRLKAHMMVHSGPDGKRYKCAVCDRAFTSNAMLRIHMRSHTGERPYKCHLCQKAFTTSKSRYVHLMTHTGERTHACPICDRKFHRFYLKQHMRMHTGEKRFKCTICEKFFTANFTLKNHMKMHTSENIPRCLICFMSFSKVSDLQYHIMVHLRQQLMRKCRFCNKSFAHRLHLQLHLRIHATGKPFRCRVCCRSFSTLYKLKIHRIIHALGRTHKCWLCGESFAAATQLASHSKAHMDKLVDGSDETCEDMDLLIKSLSSTGGQADMINDATDAPYRCKLCHRSFTKLVILKEHEVVHSEEKSFQCKLCSKSFKYGKGLKRHEVATHSGKEMEVIKCDLCEKSFSDKYNLTKHKRIQHATQETTLI